MNFKIDYGCQNEPMVIEFDLNTLVLASFGQSFMASKVRLFQGISGYI